jgi:3D (Asp-Asp-Asp) domain-containing protein
MSRPKRHRRCKPIDISTNFKITLLALFLGPVALICGHSAFSLAAHSASLAVSYFRSQPPEYKPNWNGGEGQLQPLGMVNVTRYTHNEGGRITASGYYLKNEDDGKVCAISRDWWKSKVQPGDMVFLEGFIQPCVALDTMATHNRNGYAQKTWVDVYHPDVANALRFGIQRRRAWMVKKKS